MINDTKGLPCNLRPVVDPSLKEHKSILHAFFTREGGVSHGVYTGLNCGPGSNDDAVKIRENRKRATEYLHKNASLVTAYQVHGSHVAHITQAPEDGLWKHHADAMVTNTPYIALGVLTADCVPVLFADPVHHVIGAAHAGWKGACGGVIENTIAAMESCGAERTHIIASIGPAIAQESYEVGQEFYSHLLALHSDNTIFFNASSRAEHYQFNLKAYVLSRLTAAGIHSACDVNEDTYAQEDRFFSYRRTTHHKEDDYGRQLSTIMLTDPPRMTLL